MYKTVVILAAIALALASNCAAAPPDLSSLDWSVRAVRSLAANPPADDAIAALMSKLDDVPDHICYARFADLEHSGTLSLVVSAGEGRACPLRVIDKSAAGLQEYDFDMDSGRPDAIRDLGRDGRLELIVPTGFAGGVQHCEADWPVIYGWTGNAYTDVSHQFKGYYEQRLASLKKQIAAEAAAKAQYLAAQSSTTPVGTAPGAKECYAEGTLSVSRGSGPEASASTDPAASSDVGYGPLRFYGPCPPPTPAVDWGPLHCDRAEAAKIERFLGERDAGMSEAIRWANSDNPAERDFASDIFADIATPEALEYLGTLSRDPDRRVSGGAKISLQHLGPPVYTVEREPVTFSADGHRSE